MAEKADPMEEFKESLSGVVVLTQALKPFCQSLDEVVEMASLALSNEGQLKLLMKLVSGKK